MTTGFWAQFDTIEPDTKQVNNTTSQNNDFWDNFSAEPDNGKWGETYLNAMPKKNVMDDFLNCLRWVKRTGLSAWQEGVNQAQTGNLETKQMLSEIHLENFSAEDKRKLDELNKQGNKTYQDYGIFKEQEYGNVIDNAPSNLKKSYVETMKMLPYMWETMKAGGVGGVVGSVVGGVAGAAMGIEGGIGGIATGAVRGGVYGSRLFAGYKTMALEGGLARNELKQLNEEIAQKGGTPISEPVINGLSIGVGVVNGFLEMVGLKAVLKTVPGGDKILENLERGCVRKLAANETVKQYIEKKWLKDYAKGVATEVSTEMAQEVSNIVADEIAKGLGGVNNTPLEQNVARVIDTGKATFGAMMFLGGAGLGAKATTIMRKQGNSEPMIKKALAEMTPAQQEEFVAQNIDTLFQSVEDIPSVQQQQKVDKLKDNFYNQLKNAGMDDAESLSNADISADVIAKTAQDFGMDLDEVNRQFSIDVQNLTDEEAYEQYQNDNIATLQGRVEQNVYNNEFSHDDDYYLDMAEEYENNDVHYQSMIAGIDGKQKVDVVDLTSQFPTDSTLTKKDLSAYIKTLVANINNLTDKDKKAIFDFVKKSKRIGKKDVFVPEHIAGSSKVEKQYKGERNTFVNNILDLLQNSTLIDIEKNTDKNKPNVDNYLRFYVPVKIGTDTYTVRVVAENSAGKNLFNILNADVYDVIVDKKMTASSPSAKGNLAKQSSNNIVPQNQQNITEITETEQITIENMLKGVLAPDKKPYFQSMTHEELLNTYLNQEFGMGTKDITDMVKSDIARIVEEGGIGEEEFNFEDIRIYGSYSKGTNRAGSDLDLIVQYSGKMSEDSMFNIFHDEELAIYDKNGNKVKIDINPINTADHGTIDDYSKILFQSAYTGSPARYEKPSLDFIGTGEGNQAHGYGLYYSQSKDVAENYRRTLTGDFGAPVIPVETIYDGEEITYADLALALEDVNNRGKNQVIKDLNDDLLSLREDLYELEINSDEHQETEFKIKDLEEIIDFIEKVDVNKLQVAKREKKGQLYKVDIPDSDVLLDEDKPFSEQPETVQKALAKVSSEKLFDMSDLSEEEKIKEASRIMSDWNGRSIYKKLSDEFGSDKKASEILNKYGIKGITYDGRQDGRCYVIFDDKAVNVLKTYYQSMVEGIDGKQEVDVVDLTSQFSTDSTLTKKDLSNYIQTLIGTQPISSKDKKALFSFVGRSKRVGKPNVYIPDHIAGSSKVENTHKGERNTAVNNITDLLQNSVLIDIDKNRDTKGKPNVDNYLRFYVPVKIGKDIYTVRISAENNTKKNVFNILNADVYDVIIDKKMPTHSTLMNNNSSSLIESASNNIVPQNNEKITIENMLKDVEDPDGKIYFQDGEQVNSTQEGIANARGFTYEAELADSVKNMIVLLKNKKDKSTYIHEFAHVYLNVLNRLAKSNSKAKERLITINKWLRYDGRGEYTTAQHEKFANGFVAYIKQGKAPTYGLKRAFEHFKKWLNDIYVALDNHSEFIMDSEAKAVFDEILGGTEYDENLKKANELYNRAVSYAEIKLAENAERTVFKQTQLSDYQRRYMNTAYDIIYYALINHPEGRKFIKDRNQMIMLLGSSKKKTNFTRKRKGIVSQSERIENILANSDDVFSSRDGFLSEWGEFFKPISEEYTDSDLALDALDVITQEKYLYPAFEENIEDMRYGGSLTEREVQTTQDILKFLLDEYKNADDKTVPLLAYNEFHSQVHPFIIDDIEKQWESATAEIDRYQSLTKMQQAKEDLKLYAAALKGHGDYHSQFVEYTTKILDRLDFMTVEDKRRVLNKINEFNTFRDIEKNLDDVLSYAEVLQEMTERRLIAEDIKHEVKQTIHEWKNGIKRTKYTYPANKLFERLRELNKYTQEEAQYVYDSYINEETVPDYTSDTVNSEDYYKTIEKMYVQFKANGLYYGSTEFLRDLLNRIQNAKFTAKIARDEMDFERRMNQIHYVDKCAQALNSRKAEITKNDKIKFLGNLNAVGFNFNGALRMIFNDDIKNWASLDYLYALKDGQVGKDRKAFLDKAKTIFGFKGKKGDILLQSKLIDMTKPEFTITQRHSPDIEKGNYRVTENNKETGYNHTVQTQQVRIKTDLLDVVDEWKPIQVKLSRMQVLYYYIQAKNPTSYAILTDDEKGQFKRGDFENLLEELTPQEKLLGNLMQISAEKYWDALNAYHIKKYHVELGKVRNYFPRATESQEVNMLEMFNDFTQYSGNGKFQKQRTAGPGTRIAPANALAILFDHMEKANTVAIMGEHLDLINQVFKNPDLKRLLENTWGEKVSREFYGQLTGNLFSGQTIQQSLQESMFGKVVGNLVKTNLFLKPQIGIKQIISFMNYGKGDEYVSAGEWFKAFTKQTFTPSEWKKNIEFMMSNEYMADRFSRGGSMDALKKQLENKFFAKTSLLDEFWGLPIALGDISAIILGGKPYIDVLMQKGYSKEEAFKIFIETTVNDQQSSIPSTLSNAQRNAAKQPFSKMFFAYQNTPWQYYRQCTSAIMNAVQSGKAKDIKTAGKMVILYGWLFPAIFNMVSSLSPLALIAGGDDDDILNDINPLRTITSLLTQHPIFGELINGILNAVDGQPFYSNDLLSKHVKSVNKLIRDVKKDGITLKDLWDATCAFVEPSTGLPLGSAGNAISGVYDMTQGDLLKGTLKALGYSDYRARKATGEN